MPASTGCAENSFECFWWQIKKQLRKKKVFQCIRRNEDKDEISLVDKGKIVARGSESIQTIIN